MDAIALARVQPSQIGLGENHPAQQVVNEARPTAAQGRQNTGRHAQCGTDAGSVVVEFLHQVRGAGQVKTAQLAGALVAVTGERHVDEQAQVFADLPQLMWEIENATTALGVALLVHAHDHQAVQAPQ
ncbi:hypothetical protein D3C78_1535910 [compost metagenome]